VVYNFYFQHYTFIPPDLKEYNNMNNNQTSLSVLWIIYFIRIRPRCNFSCKYVQQHYQTWNDTK